MSAIVYFPPAVTRLPGPFPRYQVMAVDLETGFGYSDVVWGRRAAEQRQSELAERVRHESRTAA